MMLSFFESQTRLINALKDEPNFIKEYGKDFMRAYHEEMEYATDHRLKCTPKVRHKTIRVLCIESLHLKNDWRLC